MLYHYDNYNELKFGLMIYLRTWNTVGTLLFRISSNFFFIFITIFNKLHVMFQFKLK